MATVAVVEDEPDVRAVIARHLATGGHNPVAIVPNEAVFELLASSGFDIVVTDLTMPNLTGRQIADWVRRHRPHTPVILLSGLASAGEAAPGLFDLVLSKPIRRHELLRAVEEVLQRTGRH